MLKLTSSQQATLTVEFFDKAGNLAEVDGPPVWGVDNTDVLALEVAPSGMSAVIKAVGPLGAALVSVQADGDLGDGQEHIVGTLETEVGAGQAAVVEITAGTPEEQV